MTTPQRLRARVLRRELHSSKAAPAISLAILAILALAWLGTECVLTALNRPPLLLSPTAMASGIRSLPAVSPGTLLTAGAALAVIGLILVVLAVTPGRRGRHRIGAGDTAVVVNDEVIGSALVRVATTTAGLSPDRAVAHVGRRTAVVQITPISGVPIDRAAVQQDLQQAAESYNLTPSIRTKLRIDQKGKVGG